MFKSKAMALILAVFFITSLSMAQYDRDAVIEILYPDQLTIVDTDYVEIDFYLAPFFAIGDSACTDCDGYIQAYLNNVFYSNIITTGPYAIEGLLDGDNFLELVVVDTGGQNFTPALHDTVTFVADYTDDYCPPTHLNVSSTHVYEALFVKWNSPSGSSGYFEDFEASDGDYIADGDWDYGSSTIEPDSAHSGNYLWGVNIGSDYVTMTNAMLDSPPISLGGFGLPQLSFWHWYDTEYSWDGGNVKLSVDGGTTWEIIEPTRGYDDDAASTANAGIPGEPCFSGHNQGFWEEVFFDLTAYAGEEVIFRWHFGSDGSVQYPGWFIDDVSVGEPDVRITGRTEVAGCGDLIRFDLFRDDVLVASLDTTFYLDTLVTNGTEYCYFAKSVYDTSGVEINSEPTDTVCGTPGIFTPPPPTYLSAAPGDEEVALFWAPPGTVVPEGDNCMNPYVITDDIADGTSLVLNGTTTGFANDFMNGFSAGSPDVVYQFNVIETVDIAFSLCGGATWDTYLMLLSGDCMDILAYDDDGCTTGLQSLLEGTLAPGMYKIVVDGYGTTNSGPYTLAINASAATRSTGFTANIVDYEKPVDPEILAHEASRDISGSSVVANNGYLADGANVIDFTLTVVSTDNSECDSFAVTFPASVTVLDAGPFLLEGMYEEEFNGVNGQTISWGSDRNDGNGGISGSIDFWAVLIFDASQTGPVTCDYFFSDDGDATIVDASGTFDIDERVPTDGEFLGYNIYIDNAVVPDNDYSLPFTNYLVESLTNGLSYNFGVTAVYYPEYESDPATVSATPTWLFGDLTGVISDPIGNLLDSAIVTVGGLRDTTGTDGLYMIYGLVPGDHTVNVSRPGFDGSTADVTIIAQEAAVIKDFTMIPRLGRPMALEAFGGDHLIDLQWHSPGEMVPGEWMFFHDGTFENAIASTNGGMGLGQVFVPQGYPATIQALRFHVSDYGSFDQDIEVNVYADDGFTVLAGPYIVPGVNNDWIEIDIDDATIEAGAFLVATYNVLPDGPYISIDEDSYSASLFFGSAVDGWTEMGDYGFFAEGSHEALIADGGRSVAIRPNGSLVDNLSTDNTANWVSSAGYHGPSSPRLPDVVPTESTREDSLIGYNVYQLAGLADTLVASTANGDTTATIIVDSNYVEYCFTVKAVWETDLYDTLESKPSGLACAETFKPGDVDFSDAVDITDLMILVDFVLGITDPSEDQFRGGDINRDGMINIQDVILIVDLIFGSPLARYSESGTGSATLSMTVNTGETLSLWLESNVPVRGMQFTLNTTGAALILGNPVLAGTGELLLASNNITNNEVMYIIARIDGQALEQTGNLLTIPYTLKGQPNKAVEIGLNNSKLAGMHGELIPVVERSTVIDFAGMPTSYALHQNYPNPFNPVTEIKFDLPDAGQVQLVIYNITGQKIRTLVSDNLEAGFHQVRWNGRNDRNESVATGMYFYQLTAGNYHATKKMVILK